MSEHTAGRELDALIAEKVMGWKFKPHKGSGGEWLGDFPEDKPKTGKTYREIPHYSTDIAAAWQVVEKVNAAFFDDVDLCLRLVRHSKWRARWGGDMRSPIYEADADDAPLAVCLAALKAMGAE